MRRLRELTVAGMVQASCRRPWLTLLVSALLCAVGGLFAFSHFSMTSDTTQLISETVDWRRHEKALDAAFPQFGDTIVIVVDGATPEVAETAAAQLTDKLQPRKDLFFGVTRPDASPFFAREGLLLLPTSDVLATTDQLVSAQPFLGPLAADPSLRGVMTAISTLATGAVQGQTPLASVDKPIQALGDALQRVAAGKPTFFSWQKLLAQGPQGQQAPTRRFIIVRPRLDYSALMPGENAGDAIRQAAGSLALDSAHGVNVRLTGSVPLSDEEFSSLEDGVWLVMGCMGLAVVVMLWFAVKSVRLLSAILVTTVIGLILTSAVGLAAVGRFNLISVAFIPLFVGLAVDFGIQFCVRFRAERLTCDDIETALVAAGANIGRALFLAAAAITLGFLAFLPTQYIGVSQLGIIAGLGMIIGLTLNLTLLPAIILLLKAPRQRGEVGLSRVAPLDRFLLERRNLVLWVFAGSTAVSVALLPFVRFDFNPLHLRNVHGEAMSTLLDIMRDPTQTPNKISALAPSLPAADKLAARLGKLPEVAQVVTLSSFVPEDQPAKLAAIADAQMLLDPTLNPLQVLPPPSDAETIQALLQTAGQLRAAAGPGGAAGAADALRLAAALEALAKGPPEARARAEAALAPPLRTMLDQIRNLLLAGPVTLQSLPPDLVHDWVTPDGRARVEVSPAGDSNNNKVLEAFSKAVLKAAPEASGAPISIQAAGRTISWAFIQAGLTSLIIICALLVWALRSLHEVAFTLAPIVLAGFLTLATCVLIGQPINFANIIAFPLLFGVGVAFHIYFVLAWRGGATHLLQSSLARGVFFSAMTTGTAFGSLMLSNHPGTASMGKILMISLIWTLVAALIFEPALLGPPEKKKRPPG